MIRKSTSSLPANSDPRKRRPRSHRSTPAGTPIPPHYNHQLDKLLIELSGTIASLPDERVDPALINSLRWLVRTLGADRSVFGFFKIDGSELTMTHCYSRPGISRIPASAMTQQCPRLLEELRLGEVIRFSRGDDLPSQAAAWGKYCRQQDLQSGMILPLCSHGSSRFVLTVSSLTKNLEWPNSILHPMWLIGNLMVGAVIRRRQETDLRNETELSLMQEHQFVDSVIESMPGNFFVLDEHGRLVRWNHNLERVYGFSAQELPGMEAAERLIPEDREKYETMVTTCLHTGSATSAYKGRTRDGQRIPFKTRAVRTQIGNGLYIIGVESDISEQMRTEDRLRQLSGCLIDNQEKERHRLAQELHDDIGQRLALLTAQLDLFFHSPKDGSGDHPCPIGIPSHLLDNMRVLASDVQKMAHGLHPAKLDQLGLPAALRSLCRDIANLKHFRMSWSVQDIARGLPPLTALCFYRLAQESLHNVVKHSAASEASVKLDVQGSELCLVVSDNGIGFDPQSESIRSGLGIISMKERLRQVSGTFLLRSKPGDGTRVEARAPWTGASGGYRYSPQEVVRREQVSRPTVFLVDDHTMMVDALRTMLAGAYNVVGVAANGREVLASLPQTNPDVVVLDMGMPLLNGLDTARQIRRLYPHIKLIMLTVDDDPDLAEAALQAGISGYLLKTSVGVELAGAIAAVFKGDRYVTQQMQSRMEEAFVRRGAATTSNRKRPLTVRQREVLQLLVEGRTMKEAAEILKLTSRTIAFHKYRIMELHALKTTADLIKFARDQRMLGAYDHAPPPRQSSRSSQ
jgi:PAS domain S-box-containing protein